MERKEGYIDVLSALNIRLEHTDDEYESSLELYDILSERADIDIVRHELGLKLVFSFKYDGKTYYFKYSSTAEPMNELFANEVCRALDISHVEYDLAVIGPYKGVISKDFKDPEATYVTGFDILKEAHPEEMEGLKYDDEDEKETLIKRNYFKSHTLEGIWDALEIRYKNRDNSREIIENIMKDVVRMFVLDVILNNGDRHFTNWMVKEYKDGRVEFQDIFDNAEIFYKPPHETQVGLTVETRTPKEDIFNRCLWEAIRIFMDVSSAEFKKQLLESMWVLKDTMVEAMCDFIWDKIDYPVGNKMRNFYVNLCSFQLEFLKDELGINRIPAIRLTDVETLIEETSKQNSYFRNIAGSVFTPSQSLHASLIDQTIETHQHIFDELNYKMYGESSEEINEYLIQARYVLKTDIFGAFFDIPYYITPKQYEDLTKTIEILLSHGVEVMGSVHPFNPITGKDIENIYDTYKSGTDILDYLKSGAHIIDYALPFEEKILAVSKETSKTI